MDEQRKTILSTLKALKQGLLTAEQAVAILKLAGVDASEMLNELAAHMPPAISSTQSALSDDADSDERLTVLLSDQERVQRAVAALDSPDAPPETLEFPEEAPQSGISLDTRTLFSLDAQSQQSSLAVGSRLTDGAGRYAIKREFARGGMGRILLARDNDVGRDVALKELLPELASGGTRVGTRAMGSAGPDSGDDPGDRFLREAKVTGQLEHPNIVPVYEIGERQNGSVYYTMKYVRGKTMAARLREIRKDDSLSDEQKNAERLKLLDPFVATCNAIAFAHSRGVIHRDLKPENIMLGDFGETLLLDWGLARVKGQNDPAAKKGKERNISDSLRESADASRTQDGYIIGTPAYMPPEQGRGEQEEIDEKSDIYSLGAVLYEILAGGAPYEGPTAGLVLQAMLTGPPVALATRNKFAPRELCAVVEKAMAREKKDRFKTAMELSQQVTAFREGRALSVYHYSALEMAKRYVTRHKAVVSIVTIGLSLALAGGVYAAATLMTETSAAEEARRTAERARDTSRQALAHADEAQRSEREARRRREAQREAELRARANEIKARKAAVDSLRIAALRDEASGRLEMLSQRLDADETFTLQPEELRELQVLLASLAGYISAKESLLAQLHGLPSEKISDLLGPFNYEAETVFLLEDRLLTAWLAAYTGDFALADHTLGPARADSEYNRKRSAIKHFCTRLLALHKDLIERSLAAVRAGLGRSKDDRPLSYYVDQLSALRERQTVELLAAALEPFRRKAEAGQALTTPEYDEIRLLLRVLGQLDMPADTVPVLARILPVLEDPELQVECAQALCATRSEEAFAPLAELASRRFNYVWEAVEKSFAQVSVPDEVMKPLTPANFLRRSLAKRARGDFAGAIADCSEGLALVPRNELLLIARGFAKKAKSEFEGAIADFTAAIDIKGVHLAQALIARGYCFIKQGDIDRSLADFSHSVELDPKNATAFTARALARLEAGDREGAQSDIAQALILEPRRAQTWTHSGRIHEYFDNHEQAFKDYSQAIECDPEYAEAYTFRGILFRRTPKGMDFNRSIKDLTRASVLNPGDARNYAWRAESDYGNGDLIAAINDCTKAISLDKNYAQAWYYRAITYLKMDERREKRGRPSQNTDEAKAAMAANLESAVVDLLEARRLNPMDFRTPFILSQSYVRLGDLYFELGEPDKSDDVAVNEARAAWRAKAREAWLKAIPPVEELRRANPYGAHYYNGEMGVENIDACVFMARIRLDSLLEAKTPLELLTRARAFAELSDDGSAGTAEQRLAWLRMAREDWSKTSPAERKRAECRPMAVEAFSAQLRSAAAHNFHADALEIFDSFDDADADHSYAAARQYALLAEQYRVAGVLRLGQDNQRRAELEFAANSKSAADRDRERARLIDCAFAMIERAFKAGYRDLPRAAEDSALAALRADARWTGVFKNLEAIVKSSPPPITRAAEPAPLVLGVLKGSQAEKCGLLPMDVLWTINGIRPKTTLELKMALFSGKMGENLKVTVRRYKISPEGFFLPKTGSNGKPILDGDGFVQWEYEEREVELKRGTFRSLGFTVEGGWLAVGVGKVPAPTRP